MDYSLRILLADDENLIRRKVRMLLGSGFRIDEADTAGRALEASSGEYDAVLLDIVFPDGNGIDLCRRIKECDPYVTVIISSSLESVDAWNEAFQAGADGYLEKRELLGLDPRKIQLMVRNLVERNRLKRKAEEHNRRQSELLSVLSHDVRAPFQALLGTIDLLRKSPMPQPCAENVEALYVCAKDQLEFINSLLDLLRLESRSVGLRRSSVDLNLPVNQSLQGLRVLAAGKGISIETKTDRRLPPVEADLAQISRLVNNLVSNAIKFTPSGGIVTVATRSVEQDAVPGVEMVVEDTGIGITTQDREKIFQRFHRGRETGTQGERGSGLGLSICKEIVHLHGGVIEIDPYRTVGTSVKVWFPARATQSLAHKTRAPATCETQQCFQTA